MDGKLGNIFKERFSVIDPITKNLVPGIDPSEFIVHLVDPDDLDSGITHVITELSIPGHYSLNFTPNKIGTWYNIVTHPTYFPWGKTNDVQIHKNDIDSIGDSIMRVLGLSQENYFLDNLIYNAQNMMTGSRIRIYNNSINVGTNSDILSTYDVSASYDVDGKMASYSVMKI